MGSKFLSIIIEVTVMTTIVSVVLTLVHVGVLVFIHISIVGRMRPRPRTAELDGSGMSPEDLELVPSYEFQPGDKNSIECAVCLESFEPGEKCRMLPVCKHSFHAHCLDSWLVRNPACPVCRTPAEYLEVESEAAAGDSCDS
ncbi:putative transcription factor C2H2 family [Dioscorea sansibarensis]